MKTKHLLLLPVMLILTALTAIAQDKSDKKFSVADIPFGEKLPSPDIAVHPDQLMPQMIYPGNAPFSQNMSMHNANAIKKNPDYFRQLLLDRRKKQTPLLQNATPNRGKENEINANSNFHLLKDINALTESYPRNIEQYHLNVYDNIYEDSLPYAVLNDVIYFVADDGIHGSELWRSDGTGEGTFMVKDIEPGLTSSFLYNITALNGKIYFTGYTSTGNGAWVSDGTESGTQFLASVSEQTKFFAIGKKVYFIADGFDFWSAIWETDGTSAGTKQVIDLAAIGSGGQQIIQPTVVNGVLFFIFVDYQNFDWHLWRSDLTQAGTYPIGAAFPALDPVTFELTNYIPMQLTIYKNKLYFSANDGTGRKLWMSDGTDAGTKLVPGNHNVIIDADYTGTSFPIVNNILCVPGEEATEGNGLYKYDVADGAGLVKIKDFAPIGDTAFIVPREMQVVNNTLYFKVTSYTGGLHDELWSSGGKRISTKLVQKFSPDETISNIYNGSGICYFVKRDKYLGTELWRTFETWFGTFPIPVSDIFRGPTSSYPAYLTAFKGKLIFGAADEKKGYELFMTGGTVSSTNLVKDINTVSTTSSNAGFNFWNYLGYGGMAALGNNVLFNAYERVHGYELYKSDGTTAGTELLNDVIPGETGFNVFQILSKNNTVYFSAAPGTISGSYFIYKTDGTTNGLSKIVSDNFLIQSFNVADNGLVFYTHYNPATFNYELWRSNGTASGTFLLSPTLNYTNCLNVVGNKAFFGAGDAMNGYELWTSDGSVAGTKLVKDINPGIGNSSPAGMAIYKNEVYFAADNGSGPSFWKSDGTNSGTIQLRQIDPFYASNAFATEKYYFEVSNNILYFSAIDYADSKGTQLWRTDGTPAGTYALIDISPNANSFYPVPSYFTDVNGTLFFIGDDGVNGAELWKSDGTAAGTQLVKDITPGIGGSNINHLRSFAGKLYFANAENKDGLSGYYLWSSDGTNEGTNEVGGFGISHIAAILPAGNNLFLTVYTTRYGAELYAGKVNSDERLVTTKISSGDEVRTNLSFDALVYPNPANSSSSIQIKGDTRDVNVTIADISGKKLWQTNSSNVSIIHLPTEKYAAGIYVVTVTSGIDRKTIRLVKQ